MLTKPLKIHFIITVTPLREFFVPGFVEILHCAKGAKEEVQNVKS